MCRRVECNACGKPTFAGCGMHVEQVLGSVPVAERCRCREEKSAKPKGEGDRSEATQGRSWLDRLLSR